MAVASHPTLQVHDLEAGYFGKPVISGITFLVDQAGIYVVLGPNGAGKTTLLRTIAGILKPLKGEVKVGGYPAESRFSRERLGYLTHLEGIPEGMTVGEALRFYAQIEGATQEDIERVVSQLELTKLFGRRLAQLSQGQRKRVSVARAFLKQKEIYLLDEPTANLDPKVSGEIRNMILDLSADKVVLYSSHNLFEAREIGRYVIALNQGRLSVFGRIDQLKVEKYIIGVRTLDGSEPPSTHGKAGEYYLYEVDGPDGVPELVSDLVAKGVRIREVREMTNPLEELFK